MIIARYQDSTTQADLPVMVGRRLTPGFFEVTPLQNSYPRYSQPFLVGRPFQAARDNLRQLTIYLTV